jgi:HD-GYP domain-containing protein (c-di-GMP phosphodiesterase class II)
MITRPAWRLLKNWKQGTLYLILSIVIAAAMVPIVPWNGPPNVILEKRSQLTDEEWKAVRLHAEVGSRIVSSAREMIEIGHAILAHHERWDGRVYPKGIKRQDIPIEARIIALADSYVTMTSRNSYRGRMSREQAIAEIRKNKGTQFDPELAELFIEKAILGKFVHDARLNDLDAGADGREEKRSEANSKTIL